MNGGRYIKQALIASLCEHPDQEKYKTRAFSNENLEKVMEALAEQRNTLTKADFFTPDDEGKYIIDTPGFWRNYDKILALVEKSGDKFTMDDFLKPLGPHEDSTNLIDSARKHGGFEKVFSAATWTGRYDEMERLWYRVPMPSRRDLFRNDGQIDQHLKRKLLSAEGRDMPEDRLSKAGLTPHDIRQAFEARGNFEDINRRLTQAGDWMRKEYLLMPDNTGDTVFYHQGAWDRYNDVVKNMQKHGEQMEPADFIRQVGYVPNVLARASERKALNHVFNPDHWVDRLPDMMEVWSYVREGWKAASLPPKDFDSAYAEAESKTYGKLIDFGRFEAKTELLRPLNVDAVDSGAEKQVLPLGLKSFWDEIDTVRQKLANMGEKLSIADLRQKSGQLEDSCLMGAVKFGRFADVVEMASKNGEAVALDDFLTKDRHGNTMLNILAERNELDTVFAPELWAGRVADMKQLWTHVRINDRSQVDIQQAEVAAKQATLKLQVKDKFKLKPRKPGG